MMINMHDLKEHLRSGQRGFWFAFPRIKGGDILQNAKTSYIAFACGSEALILLI
jgi:hypothetical protein